MNKPLSERSYAVLLFAVVLACYGFILSYPHIQDDWRTIRYLSTEPGLSAIMHDQLNPYGRLFFRPLSRIYHVASYRAFGLHAVGFHTLALLWLWAGSWLVSRVMREFTADLWIGRAAGICYAAATSVHMDTMLWEAGINELGAACFVLLSALLFLKGRQGAAAASWFAALMFKEAAIFLPAVLFLIAWSRKESLVRRLCPFGVALLLYVIPKSLNLAATSLPDSHPYAVRFSPAHLPASICLYLEWIADALFPYAAEAAWKNNAFAALAGHPAAIIFVCVAAALATIALAGGVEQRRRNAILLAWAVLGLALVLILPSHVYRYYLTYALPPLTVLLLLAVRGVVSRITSNPRAAVAILMSVVAIQVAAGARYFARRHHEGLDQQFRDGTNHLIARGQTVNLVWSALKQLHPTLPPGSVLIFDGVEILSFDVNNGPAVWYGDPSLHVLALDYVHRNREGDSIRTQDYAEITHLGLAGSETVRLARGTTFAFRMENRQLRDVTEDFFTSIGM